MAEKIVVFVIVSDAYAPATSTTFMPVAYMKGEELSPRRRRLGGTVTFIEVAAADELLSICRALCSGALRDADFDCGCKSCIVSFSASRNIASAFGKSRLWMHSTPRLLSFVAAWHAETIVESSEDLTSIDVLNTLRNNGAETTDMVVRWTVFLRSTAGQCNEHCRNEQTSWV